MTNSNNEWNRKQSKKVFKVARYVIWIALIVSLVQFFFDNNHKNDYIGWLILIGLILVRSLYDFVKNLKERNKTQAIVDILFVVIAAYFLLTFGLR
ncbi:hypothetical protein [Paraliobacillus ryukyuensis]|uniref:hypothetical protein n=1 Tax=Paraliobacillus ryukyuensis TaxID=200904 RepID=UPI0009A60EF8|nr:hypothetical protein [Paraliobacillus ryukyuensis]